MNQKRKILVVDDEKDITDILQFGLEYEGFAVTSACSAEEALSLMKSDRYELLILDVMLDGITGFDMAEQLRKEGDNTPIIFLTAKDTEQDILTGFSIGGDDYVKKPFSIKELIARVHSVINRVHLARKDDAEEETCLKCSPLVIDLEAMKVSTPDGEVDVTKTEYDILKLLVSNVGRVFSRAEILDAVWPDDSLVLERTVDVHIARLRRKLGEYANCIVNRVGFGYTFKSN